MMRSIDLGYASVTGTESDGAVAFRSIRFGQDVSGEARYDAPRAVETLVDVEAQRIDDVSGPWQEVGNPKNPTHRGHRPCEEDVLLLHVWRPQGHERDLPVFVFLHGGNLIHGSAAWPIYDGTKLSVKLNAVVVGVGYRLGLPGWGTDIRGWESSAASLGLQDQRTALIWIKRHIEAFGGDAGNITLAGHSAGATTALLHAQFSPDSFTKLALFSAPLNPQRREEVAATSATFRIAEAQHGRLVEPTAEPKTLLDYQNDLDRAWAEAHAGLNELLGIERPSLGADTSYAWECDPVPRTVPIFGTWNVGEFGPVMGETHREAFVSYFEATRHESDQFRMLPLSDGSHTTVGDIHLALIPALFGVYEPWADSGVKNMINSDLFKSTQDILHSALADFIR